MSRVKSYVDHVRLSPPQSDAASPPPASNTTKRPGLLRSNAVTNFGALVPIGKREQVKRFLVATFAVSRKPIALDGPVRRQARPAAPVKTPLKPPVANLALPTASLAARYSALKPTPQNTQPNKPSDPNRPYPSNAALGQRLFTIHEGDNENDNQ